MSAHDNLSPTQFYVPPENVGNLVSGDFGGRIGTKAAEKRFVSYNNSDGLLAKHREAGGVKPYLDQFTQKIAEDGEIREPITLREAHHGTVIHDGHHRALAAHRLGLGLHARMSED